MYGRADRLAGNGGRHRDRPAIIPEANVEPVIGRIGLRLDVADLVQGLIDELVDRRVGGRRQQHPRSSAGDHSQSVTDDRDVSDATAAEVHADPQGRCSAIWPGLRQRGSRLFAWRISSAIGRC